MIDKELIKKIKLERQEYLEGWQRSQADFQNYIKQKNNEMEVFRKFAADNMILRILPVFDNFAAAYQSVPDNLNDDQWTKGITQILNQFEEVLRESGVKEINASPGNKFDPALHESLGEMESDDVETGSIAQLLQRGYMLHDKVIRPAKVKIAK
jgi:molecular chaperone GrpE